MRLAQLSVFLLLSMSCFSQDSIPVRRIDTLLPFFGNKSLNLMGYENRAVPYNDKLPLYVMITYSGGKRKSLEYFRIDSSNYLVYQYFRGETGSSNKGLKSKGRVKIIEAIVDSSYTTSIGASTGNRSIYKRYYKGFSKEGEWHEYEDSLFYHKYWTGNYTNNVKTGIWNNYIYEPNGERLIAAIDYDSDSAVKLYSTNLAGNFPTDSIALLLKGRWKLACEDDKDRRMNMSKCMLYNGQFGDDCNSRFGDENYYEFLDKSVFKRQKGETCNKFKQNTASGQWKVIRNKNDLLLDIKLSTGYTIRYRILYLDREGNMIADRE